MTLTDLQIKTAKPKAKPYKMGDGQGLFLLVQPSGGKLWRMKYRIAGREKKLSLGRYPDTTLAQARKGRDAAREQLAVGRDPSLEKQRAKARSVIDTGNTFEIVAREYIEKRCNDGDKPWTPATRAKSEWLLSELGSNVRKLPVTDIEPSDILAALRKIEARGKLESAKRAQQFAGAVLRYAVATARLRSDPTRDLKGALLTPKVTHRAAILDPVELGGLLRAIDGYQGNWSTLLALRLAPHVFQRPGELRHAEWSEIDLDAALWTIPAEKMKMRQIHHVPLSRQAIEIIDAAAQLGQHDGPYVFPSVRTPVRPLSENSLNAALRRLGYTKDQVTTHGFRSTATTLLNESGKWHPDAIERALAHKDSNKVRGAYNRGEYWDERVRMMQWWSDYLDQLKAGGEVVAFPKNAAK